MSKARLTALLYSLTAHALRPPDPPPFQFSGIVAGRGTRTVEIQPATDGKPATARMSPDEATGWAAAFSESAGLGQVAAAADASDDAGAAPRELRGDVDGRAVRARRVDVAALGDAAV